METCGNSKSGNCDDDVSQGSELDLCVQWEKHLKDIKVPARLELERLQKEIRQLEDKNAGYAFEIEDMDDAEKTERFDGCRLRGTKRFRKLQWEIELALSTICGHNETISYYQMIIDDDTSGASRYERRNGIWDGLIASFSPR